MGFWDRFYSLCIENNTKPSPVVKQLGIASGAVTKWKNGTLPTLETAILIANYFNVSVGYLIGETDTPHQSEKSKIQALYDALPENQKEEAVNYLNYLGSRESESE